MHRVTGRARVRQLQLATRGLYKTFLVEKIVEQLKVCFLEARKSRMKLSEVLKEIGETEITDELKEWLVNESLSAHPRVYVFASMDEPDNIRLRYKPPLKFSGKAGLLKLLQERFTDPEYRDTEGIGVLKSHVYDSIQVADRIIRELLEEGKILEVMRLDRKPVLMYRPAATHPLPMEPCFQELWHSINVSNKELPRIQDYLKNRGLHRFQLKLDRDGEIIPGTELTSPADAEAGSSSSRMRKRGARARAERDKILRINRKRKAPPPPPPGSVFRTRESDVKVPGSESTVDVEVPFSNPPPPPPPPRSNVGEVEGPRAPSPEPVDMEIIYPPHDAAEPMRAWKATAKVFKDNSHILESLLRFELD